MEYRFVRQGCNTLSQSGTAHQMHCMVGAVIGMHFPAHILRLYRSRIRYG